MLFNDDAVAPQPLSLTEQTIAQIKNYIIHNNLSPGSPLPTEKALVEQLGVARSGVREAMRTLAALDIVSVQHGRGTFVGDMSMKPLVDTIAFKSMISVSAPAQMLLEVIEIRRGLDLIFAPRVVAAYRGTTNPNLRELVEQMVELANQGRPFMAQDRAFHAGLLSNTKTAVFGNLVEAFWDIHTNALPRRQHANTRDLTQTARAHGLMLDAAEDGDLAAYEHAVTLHYEPLERALNEGN